jgi:2-haloacid dehalogenase
VSLLVTLDLFSAATDTARGAAATFTAIAAERRWPVSGPELYAAWDARNKAAQRTARPPVTFAEVSELALAAAYDDLDLPVEHAAVDRARVHAGVGDWPLWPDLAAGVTTLRATPEVAAVGLLSNVDDDLARDTRAAALVDGAWLLTSQRLGAYKPDPAIYRAARDAAGAAGLRLVHVAASARDVRGALEAGIPAVRLARPGHALDPDGPPPPHEVADARDLPAAVLAAAQG